MRKKKQVSNSMLCSTKVISLSSCLYPFLTVGVSQVVDSLRVPLLTDTEQCHWQETVFSHDNEVDEESGSCLNHTDLTISHGDEPSDVLRSEKFDLLQNVQLGFLQLLEMTLSLAAAARKRHQKDCSGFLCSTIILKC